MIPLFSVLAGASSNTVGWSPNHMTVCGGSYDDLGVSYEPPLASQRLQKQIPQNCVIPCDDSVLAPAPSGACFPTGETPLQDGVRPKWLPLLPPILPRCRLPALRRQVLPDLAIQIQDADEKGDGAFIDAAGQRAEAFAENQCLGADDALVLQSARRVAGVKHMRAWDNSLQQAGLLGLVFFQVPPEKAGIAIGDLPFVTDAGQRFPSLTLALDQGPQSFPTNFFLGYYMKLNMFCHFDASHRLWNDVKDSLAECGHWSFICLSIIALNLDYGPWEGSEFFSRGRLSFQHFLTNCGPDHALVRSVATAIAEESGIDRSGLSDAEFCRRVFDSLSGHEAWQRKSIRVGLSRWFGWQDSATSYLKVWSVRHLTYIWLCIVHGYGKFSEHGWMLCEDLQRPERVGAAEASDATPMSRGNEKNDTMRSKCKNTLHLVTAWLSDFTNHRKMRIFTRVLAPLREFHGQQNSSLGSCSEAQAFFLAQARGAGLTSVTKVLSLLQTPDGLEDLGFRIDFNVKTSGKIASEADLVEENEWLAMVVDLAFAIAKHRVLTCSHYMWSFPGAFCLATSPEPADQLDLLQWMADAWAAWESLHSSPFRATKFWTSIVDRSVFQLQMVRLFFRQALEHEFLEFDPVQRAMALDITAGFCQTKLIEDGVHEGAECERHESRNGEVAPRAVWTKVISSSVMSSVHRYPEVKVDSTMQLARADKIAPLPGTLHNPLRRRPFLRCRLGRYVGVLPCRCRNYRR